MSEEAKPKRNWRRMLHRLWIVATGVWLALILLDGLSHRPDSLDLDCSDPTKMERHPSISRNCTTDFKTGKRDLDCFRRKCEELVEEQAARVADWKRGMVTFGPAIGLGFPLAILAFGHALGWAFGGLRGDD